MKKTTVQAIWDEDENSVKVQSNSLAASEKNNGTFENASVDGQEDGEAEMDEPEIDEESDGVDEILTRRK